MLFNSFEFIFLFLPVVFAGFFFIGRKSHAWAAGWLAIASLFFYAYWRLEALPYLLVSIAFNYLFGYLISPDNRCNDIQEYGRNRKLLLGVALSFNLGLLGYFKYANFFISNANVFLGQCKMVPLSAVQILLPIGISFYTFTQIAFLIDSYQGKVEERNFLHYLLFVSYFPHLISGPILHHKQMMPQFARAQTYRFNLEMIVPGVAICAIGLGKKVLLADPLGGYSDMLFNSVTQGLAPELFLSWFGVLAYTFQIYFDFSGYTDMAIGISLLFGIVLPINFNSPYRAASIIEFWRCWHISLSTFLRDYLYFPLGGNRLGKFRRYVNLLITMILGGLWHGANWTFVLWGFLHGIYLTINHLGVDLFWGNKPTTWWIRISSWLVTFTSVVVAWVLFRSDKLHTATVVYRGLLGFNGISLPESFSSKMSVLPGLSFGGLLQRVANNDGQAIIGFSALILISFGIILFLPNTSRLIPSKVGEIQVACLKLSPWMAVGLGILFACSLLRLSQPSPFLYFQF